MQETCMLQHGKGSGEVILCKKAMFKDLFSVLDPYTGMSAAYLL